MQQSEADALQEQVQALLETLGDSPEQVAEMLDHEECFGWPQDATACPLWHLLNREHGNDLDIHVDIGFTEVWEDAPPGDREYLFTVDHPDPVADFLRLFDHEGEFQFLKPEED